MAAASDPNKVIRILEEIYSPLKGRSFTGQYVGEFVFRETTEGIRKVINYSGDDDLREIANQIDREVDQLSEAAGLRIWKGIHRGNIYMNPGCSLDKSYLKEEEDVIFRIYHIQVVAVNPIRWDIVCNLFLKRA